MTTERNRCQGNRGIPQAAFFAAEDMPRKSLDIRFTEHPVKREKGPPRPFPCFRRGRVWAEPSGRVKGPVPCGFLGQRPEPSESLSLPISAIFKVHLSLFFRLLFFITHLTLSAYRTATTRLNTCLMQDRNLQQSWRAGIHLPSAQSKRAEALASACLGISP